jgi:hypothetical protein
MSTEVHTLSVHLDEGRVALFVYDMYQLLGQSFHECSVEAVRGDDTSTWSERGGATRILLNERSPTGARTVTIAPRHGGLRVTFSKGSHCGTFWLSEHVDVDVTGAKPVCRAIGGARD